MKITEKKVKNSKPQRERIMEEARILFWRKGYASTSMRDIASACDFKPANIYNFFVNKEEILYEILADEMEQVLGAIGHLEHDTATNPIEQLRVLIDAHVSLTLGYRRSSKLLFDAELESLSPARRKKIITMRDAYDRILCGILRRGIDRGVFDAVDEKLAAFSIASMCARSRIWFSPNGRLAASDVSDFIFHFALNGLKSKKIRAPLKTDF